MGKVVLKTYELSDEVFDKLLFDFQADVTIVPSIDPYMRGYKPKRVIYYDGREYLICKEYILDYYCDNIDDCTSWKQCRVRRVKNKSAVVEQVTNGPYAYNYMMKLLTKRYDKEVIENILKMHVRDYNKDLAQYHYAYRLKPKELAEIKDCYKYDINGAYLDALCEMFPNSSKDLKSLYERRRENPKFKMYPNYFIGMLKHLGYDRTYNWIVQRTTNILFSAMRKTQGKMIYANTDGYVISCPKVTLNESKQLGEFKLEYCGTVYVYRDKNYWLMQCEDEMKGNCLTEVRNMIDLRQGKVVSYTRNRILIGQDDTQKNCYIYKASDIKKEIIECQEL